MNTDAGMARIPDLPRFGSQHQVPVVTIADLIEYRVRPKSLRIQLASADPMRREPGVARDAIGGASPPAQQPACWQVQPSTLRLIRDLVRFFSTVASPARSDIGTRPAKRPGRNIRSISAIR
jgi:hypothetical protein